jgi:protein-tyrosine phosphatase
MKRLLFLCTGNYYRSRFAEILFNSLASENKLDWRADSRGLALNVASLNVGPMAQVARELLLAKGIRCDSMQRLPLPASEADFAAADLIVALDEDEHRPMMRTRFPVWEKKIVYWLVHDLDQWDTKTALTEIESQVNRLAKKLRDEKV